MADKEKTVSSTPKPVRPTTDSTKASVESPSGRITGNAGSKDNSNSGKSTK